MTDSHALVVGESLIDVVLDDDRVLSRTPGGSSFNIACGVARLAPAAAVSLLTDLGHDDDGTRLVQHLDQAGVRVLARPRGDSSRAYARLDLDGSADYEFDLRWEPDRALVPEHPWNTLHIGSLGAFLAPGAEVIDRLLGDVEDTATVRTFDPNVRPSLVGGHAAARARFEFLAQHSDVIKLSDADAIWLYPGVDLDEVLDHVLALAAGLAVLTRGAKGATLRTPSIRIDVPASSVTVIDTIGAGDSFMATLISELLRQGITRDRIANLDRGTLETLGRRAAWISGVVVGRSGAGIPSSIIRSDLGDGHE